MRRNQQTVHNKPFRAQHFHLVCGVGCGHTMLNAFDNALQNAGVGNYNLIRVSSILPPNTTEKDEIDVPQGSLLPIAYSALTTNNEGEEIAASISVAIPVDSTNIGVIMEWSGNDDMTNAEAMTNKMCIEAMSNRSIDYSDIKTISIHVKCNKDYCCVFAGIALF